MSLTLNELYRSTRNQYQLSLIAGEKGLVNIMSWVYVTEDLSSSDFLQGGELVITTGLSTASSENWLYEFIENMIKHDTCGIIINTGRYIFAEDITSEIKAMCDEAGFPLFTMPWHIHIYDITRDYYNRIFIETESYNRITDCFFSIFNNGTISEGNAQILENHGFTEKGIYNICAAGVKHLNISSSAASHFHRKLHSILSSRIYDYHVKYHVMIYQGYLLIIFHGISQVQAAEYIEDFMSSLSNMKTDEESVSDFQSVFLLNRAGMSETLKGIKFLTLLQRQAVATECMAAFHGTSGLSFCSDAGFFRLLFAAGDMAALKHYADTILGPISVYDREHEAEYMSTLRQYLICGGSISEVAETLFCHRNTVTYRIRMLKEAFGLDLSDTETCHELLSAFYIYDYLKASGLSPIPAP